MLLEEHPQPGADLARGEKEQQEHRRRGQEHDLRHVAPGAARGADPLAGSGHGEQVAARADQRRGVHGHPPRDEHIGRPAGIPRRRHRDQRRQHGHDAPAGGPRRRVQPPHQQAVGVEEHVVAGHHGQRHAQVLHGPAAVRAGVAPDLLDEQQHRHRRHQPAREKIAGRHGRTGRRIEREAQHGDRLQRHRAGADGGDEAQGALAPAAGARRQRPAEEGDPGPVPKRLGQQERPLAGREHVAREHPTPQCRRAHGGQQPHASRPPPPAGGQHPRQGQVGDGRQAVAHERGCGVDGHGPLSGPPAPRAPPRWCAGVCRGRRRGCGSSRSRGRTRASRGRRARCPHSHGRSAPTR